LLNNNSGTTTNFTGGLTLSTGASAAFTATTSGTVSATQNNSSIVNTITTTTGDALKVVNTTIGASGARATVLPSIQRVPGRSL
jgi:large repetitive protein